MSNQGRFVWYELMTSDPAAAPDFYGAVVGLKTQKWEHGDYTMWLGENGPVGGLMKLPDEAKAMGAPPHWLGSVSVADTRATAARVTALGGRVYVPPTDLPGGAGAYAVFGDVAGTAFGVHASSNPSPERPPLGNGDFIWAELMTPDLDKAWAFYAELFGWVKSGSMEMGEGKGIYQMFSRPQDPESMIGGMMAASQGQPSAWIYYTIVADVEAALATANARGATTIYPPMEVPGGDRVCLIMDPQGAAIGLCQRAKK